MWRKRPQGDGENSGLVKSRGFRNVGSLEGDEELKGKAKWKGIKEERGGGRWSEGRKQAENGEEVIGNG